jgi:glycerol-3-phosphate acyltransferase PlsX
VGLNGIVIKSHGGADANGFSAAVDIGYEMVRNDLMAKIGQALVPEARVVAETPVAGAAS